jgi:hypothetical protein
MNLIAAYVVGSILTTVMIIYTYILVKGFKL